MKPDVKKIIITNLPYLLFVWLFGKMGEAWRLAAGADDSQKMLHFMDSLAAAFANGLPSFHPFDLCIGIAGAVLVRLTVYLKGKNAKKYGVDFALRKDKTTQPPHYIVIFKSRDADNLEQAFKEFTARKLSREAKPSIRKALSVLREAAGRNVQRAKEKIRERGMER